MSNLTHNPEFPLGIFLSAVTIGATLIALTMVALCLAKEVNSSYQSPWRPPGIGNTGSTSPSSNNYA